MQIPEDDLICKYIFCVVLDFSFNYQVLWLRLHDTNNHKGPSQNQQRFTNYCTHTKKDAIKGEKIMACKEEVQNSFTLVNIMATMS